MTQSLSEMRSRFFLEKHIFYQNVDGHFIVLDLRKNEYFLLLEPEKYAFQVLFGNQSTLGKSHPYELEQTIGKLLSKEIITDCANKAKHGSPSQLPPVSQDMNEYFVDGIPKIRIQHVWKCLKAFLYTKLIWWLNPMEGVIRKLAKRKERELAKKPQEVNFEKTRELVEVFRVLRGLFYTVQDECLFDSLTMINFLASYGIYPQLVFGVQMGPFSAHAWVQNGDRIYNGHIFQASAFKPIMTV
ncbi:MAG: hypothetical protein COB49_02775 [Alphaproteobacteria bacterium]|nr:MAG: hypothetical protein COB49_02775 [Alphaproteobacteria bacterium]